MDRDVSTEVSLTVVSVLFRATWPEGGWGMFEHASMGRHDPTGFTDWMAVAP